MQQCDTLILASWCIPVEPANTVLSDHGVAVDDGRIVAVLPAAEARDRYSAGVTVERPGQVLIPGLINSHTHAAMTLFRGIADDMSLEKWLTEGVWPAEQRWASAEMVRDGTRHAVAEMLLSGVTCFSDQYFFPEIVAETAVSMHVRAMVGTPVIDFASPWAANAGEYLSKGTDLVHDAYVDHPLISSCFAPHSTAVVSDQTFSDLRVLADQLDLPVQIHLHETAQEIENSIESTGERPLDRLIRLGLVNSSLLAVHAVHMSSGDTEALANGGVSIAHCPRSNLKLASGLAPVQTYLDAGINVSLGTDGAASNNVLDMLGELRSAALLGKLAANDAAAVPALAAIRMATINGAKSIGLDDSIGTISVGKWADLTCIDLNHLNSQPVYDVASQLVYTAERSQVSDVWVAGRHHVERGELITIDLADVFQRTAEWRDRIATERDRESK